VPPSLNGRLIDAKENNLILKSAVRYGYVQQIFVYKEENVINK